MKNKPNFPRHGQPLTAKTQQLLVQTNPIYPYPSLAHDPNMRNEPNFPRHGQPLKAKSQQLFAQTNPIMQNEPNLPLPQPGPRSKYAKRTQLPHTRCPAPPYLCETNPIYPGTAKSQPPIANSYLYKRTQSHKPTRQKMQNKPNSAEADPSRTKNEKQTQFHHRIPSPPFFRAELVEAHPYSLLVTRYSPLSPPPNT